MPIHNVSLNHSFSIDSTDDGNLDGGKMRAKVMYDYVAKGSDELNLYANEVIIVDKLLSFMYRVIFRIMCHSRRFSLFSSSL